MSKTKKAGCILLNVTDKTVALVYREKHNDYSFPKGHMEKDETLEGCAIRETAEETKRDCILLEKDPIYIENYITPSGEDVEMYYFLAKDIGKSDNTSTDTHQTYWVPYEEVKDKLTYESLKKLWDEIKNRISNYFNK